MEIWKDIEGYEGLYQVSNFGNVKSLNWGRRGFARNLYLKPHNKGYLQVELVRDGVKTMITVHRLVATAFLPNPQGLPFVNHKDEDKTNNRVDNLEWCTQSYNENYFYARLASDKRPRKHYGTVIQMDTEGNVLREWENLRSIKHELGVNEWSIRECCFGKRKTAYGYKWRFAA